MRWILTILILLMALMSAVPRLTKYGLGRLPGDINFRLGRHHLSLPIASTLLIFVVCWLIAHLI